MLKVLSAEMFEEYHYHVPFRRIIFTNIICLSPSFPVVGISDRERLNVAF